MPVIVEWRERDRGLRHLVGCPVAPTEAPQENTDAIRASTSRCSVCFTPEAEAPPAGTVAVFAVFSPDGSREAYVSVSKNPENARYQLIKKAQSGTGAPEFIQEMLRSRSLPLTFSDTTRYPRASRILDIVPESKKTEAKRAAIEKLERDGWSSSPMSSVLRLPALPDQLAARLEIGDA